MDYAVLLHPRVADFLRKADPNLMIRITGHLKRLRDSPARKGERLKHTEFWRLKIGDHRAIYEIDAKSRRVIILFIGHRHRVYDDFSRLL